MVHLFASWDRVNTMIQYYRTILFSLYSNRAGNTYCEQINTIIIHITIIEQYMVIATGLLLYGDHMQQQPTQLTPTQLALIQMAHQFTIKSSEQLEVQLKASNWRDIYAIITNVGVMFNARVVCCSLLKWLIYHRKFVDDPIQLFKSLAQFYLADDIEGTGLAKAQKIVEVVLQVIPGSYMNPTQKQLIIDQLLKLLRTFPTKCQHIFTLIKFILESCDVENINNQTLAGQILLFLQQFLASTLTYPQKLSMCKYSLKLLIHLLQLINNEDDINSNVVQQFLFNSTMARKIMQQIIRDGSNNVQIISQQSEVNQVKLICLQLYTSVWVYYLQEPMFKLCLSSLLTKPDQLIDEAGQIMDRIVVMLQRSINQQAYYHYLHSNIQHIFISLASMLTPKQSYLELAESQPEQFVDILYDFCMEQQRQILQIRIGSLISSFCMYIDGFMSFVGSMCIVIIKRFNGTINQIPGADEYINVIDKMWTASSEQKVATCIMVLCAISDQLDRREDLSKPLRVQLANMAQSFNIATCKLPPYLICRFMFLYSFNAYPKCLDIFLPYKTVKPVYQCQLQSCYKIMHRYYNKFPQCKQYIDQIGPIVIMTDHLTSLLQTTILTGELNVEVQYKILEKLVGWLDDAIKVKSYIVCNKMANLITILLDRMDVKDYAQTEEAVFAYLENFFRAITKPSGSQCEQFIIEIAVAFVKRFPSLQKSKQRLMILIQMGFKVVQRNNGVLNNCLDLLFQLTRYLSYDLVRSLIQIYMGCLESQERQEDQWECYYGLETCMLRICQLGAAVPTINLSIILSKLQKYNSSVLKLKVFMFIFSLILVNPKATEHYQQYIRDTNFPTNIPPYQNKPYLLYLLTLTPHLDQTPDQSLSIIKLILQLLNEQKTIQKKIDKYEQQIYCSQVEQNHELAINSYNISRKLLHPLLMKNMDVYNQFRKCWISYQNKQYVMSQLDENTRKLILELCTQTTINSKVRKIYKVKNQLTDKESEMVE